MKGRILPIWPLVSLALLLMFGILWAISYAPADSDINRDTPVRPFGFRCYSDRGHVIAVHTRLLRATPRPDFGSEFLEDDVAMVMGEIPRLSRHFSEEFPSFGMLAFGWRNEPVVYGWNGPTDIVLGVTTGQIPYWFPMALTAIGPAIWLRQHWRARANRRRVEQGSCGACGYDLTSNVSGMCPECGARREGARVSL